MVRAIHTSLLVARAKGSSVSGLTSPSKCTCVTILAGARMAHSNSFCVAASAEHNPSTPQLAQWPSKGILYQRPAR
jgi:hypothetical protein